MSTQFEPFTFPHPTPDPSSATLPLDCTDVALSQRFVSLFAPQVCYVPAWGWLIWNSKRWHRDTSHQILFHAQQTLLSLHPQILSLPDPHTRAHFISDLARSEMLSRLKSLLTCAQSHPSVVARVESFDADPYLLNVFNGTIDLHTGTLLPHDPTHRITRLAPTTYDPHTPPGPWHAFLDDITDHDQALQDYLQRVIGYGLTGSSEEDALFFLHGTGRNGKSTWLTAIQHALGDYTTTTSPHIFLARTQRSHLSHELAALASTRLVMLTELEDDASLHLARLKLLSGGDVLSVRLPYREPFSFIPRCKLFIVTNHLPTIAENTPAIWSRIKILPFSVCFAGREDPSMEQTLRAAAPEILAWAVQGCLAWQQRPLIQEEPVVIQTATNIYRNDQDALANFLEDRCISNLTQKINTAELYQNYRDWCIQSHECPLSHKAFGMSIHQRGYPRTRTKQGRFYQGLTLQVAPTIAEILAAYESDDEDSLPEELSGD